MEIWEVCRSGLSGDIAGLPVTRPNFSMAVKKIEEVKHVATDSPAQNSFANFF
jgi:hypothetical protein